MSKLLRSLVVVVILLSGLAATTEGSVRPAVANATSTQGKVIPIPPPPPPWKSIL